MPDRNRVVVIDDKTEDGESIIRRLWDLQVPTFFFHFDPVNLVEFDTNRSFTGIRFIFQDIALVSQDLPGHDDYSAAAEAINKILSEDNGPWLLIAWSTWGDDPDNGDKYAKDLFDLLSDRLPIGKRPYDYVVIDKTPYTNGMHGTVKGEGDLSNEQKISLTDIVREKLNGADNLSLLTEWENDVKDSVSSVINNIWCSFDDKNNKNSQLGGFIKALVEAEVGGNLTEGSEISHGLYRILSQLLYDKTNRKKSGNILLGELGDFVVSPAPINSMLHYDSLDINNKQPGCIYKWPESIEFDFGNIQVAPSNLKDFIIESFVPKENRTNADSDPKFMNNLSLVVMDVTAPCDHANDKAIWRRFITGIMVNDSGLDYFYLGKRKAGKSRRMAGDYLKGTPVFEIDGEDTIFIFNSILTASISRNNKYSKRLSESDDVSCNFESLQSVGRLRDQILNEIVHWYGNMATRPGIVSLR